MHTHRYTHTIHAYLHGIDVQVDQLSTAAILLLLRGKFLQSLVVSALHSFDFVLCSGAVFRQALRDDAGGWVMKQRVSRGDA